MKWTTLSFVLVCLMTMSCTDANKPLEESTISSPGDILHLDFWLTDDGRPAYRLLRGEAVVIDTSLMGFEFREAAALRGGFEIVTIDVSEEDNTWEMLWGEQREVRNHYRQLAVELQESTELARQIGITFRLYDDGLGFRYHFPEQPNMDKLTIMDELTEFSLTGDHTCWWIPGDWDIYEHLVTKTRFGRIDARSKRNHPNLAQTTIPYNAVATPVTLKTDDGLYISFHEANLTDYSGMTLMVDKENTRFVSELVGRADSAKADISLPFSTPWRTVQVTDRAGDLIESNLIVNLNEPSVLEGDLSWIEPMKYAGIWWEMHLTKASWDMASGKHGATTANAKRYIDFCAAYGIRGLLIEGWNTGWERWIGFPDREGVFDFVTPYEDYDMDEVVRYAKENGVDIVMHHETSAAPRTYEEQLEPAYQLMERYGMHAVKTGYVGPIIPEGEYHHGQWMVQHYRKVLETAARYEVMVDAHEPIKDTGLRRTYPNMMTREGLRGQEFNAFSMEGGNPTNHLSEVAFTRMLAGPIDYTPGVIKLDMMPYKPDNNIKHTLAHELALYVVIYSPLQMVADLPENLEGQPGMQWVQDVAVDWEQSIVIDGEPGDFVTIARQERGGDRWFLGTITDKSEREQSIALSFLAEGTNYRVVTYRDAADAHWRENPTAMEIEETTLVSSDTLQLQLVPGGGAAVMFEPIGE